ncbi:hypothetical protein [Paraburkholderia rhizosphaerae]|uniref:Uncharacterized protein n=1 Tax=Paraburkholderia rhizosphaerae TaxID=480658 RepID=A0A4R8LTK7_9BURK|nr:hypothetical protein [Paraburkholderia rhizosphaerae]TDY50934.1 hypothetical protein BX592_108171 [Paraburkholderia rhizosphaerae]
MRLQVDLSGVCDVYKLCFVRMPWAFFTRLALDQQSGDRWERAPYQLHAGLPYSDSPDQILKVAFDGPLFPPESGRDGHARSVFELNQRVSPWLRTESFFDGEPLHIMAGTTLAAFVEQIGASGGNVFVPLDWGCLPAVPPAWVADAQ